MLKSKLVRVFVIATILVSGLWLLLSADNQPAAETVNRQLALQAFAPVGDSAVRADGPVLARQTVAPVAVNLRDIPAGVYDPNNQFDRWQRGEIDLVDNEGIRSVAELQAMREASLSLAPSRNIQTASGGPAPSAPTGGTAFDSIDITECCGGGANVPPDPELAVGPSHVIAVVNVAFEIYDKSGTSLVGPTTFGSFFSSDPNCAGVFDPNALYDEEADRYFMGIDADGTHYCAAVSQTGDPTGGWNIYSFNTGSFFFDYPHAGIGRDAIYMGANIFASSFYESRVYAFDKAAMYAGASATAVTRALPTTEDSPQPLNLHGWNQSTWPTAGPHYFFTDYGYNGATYSVWSWSDPFGANTLGKVGTVNLETATGVSAGMPVSVPQAGGASVQANDFRPQDFEYRNGYAWSVQTIACNPGSGTVDCVRWAQIDPATAAVVSAGVYASNGEYRFFGDLAVNACDDMALGYTKSSSGMYPSIWYTGRQSGDPAGTLQAETQLKAGEVAYSAFDAVPRRWGDYTGMTIAPDGTTFWYLGEYSKNTGSQFGRWGTYIGSFSYSCSPTGDSPPTVTITNPGDTTTVSGTVDVTADASDDKGVTRVEFFVDGASIGVDTTPPYSATWSTTGTSDGAHTVSATATDTIDQPGSDSVSVTVNNGGGAASSVHVGDLDGASQNNGKNWTASVTVLVVDNLGAQVVGATVDGNWSGGASGPDTCDTVAGGTCQVSISNIPKKESVVFTVADVSAGLPYNSGDNTDPDGDSSGTAIQINKDGTTSDPGGAGNQAPTADFTYTTAGLTVNFTDASTDEDGSVVAWSWDFGDFFTDTAQNPSHTYTAEGTYTVQLTVSDDGGATDSTSQSVTVSLSGNPISLSVNAYKDKGTKTGELTWSGASSSTVDIKRDGSVVATTDNDGFYVDITGQKGGGSTTWQVCEAGTLTCSDLVVHLW